MAERRKQSLNFDQIDGLLDAIDREAARLAKVAPRDALDDGVKELSIGATIVKVSVLEGVAWGLRIARDGEGYIPGVNIEQVLSQVNEAPKPSTLGRHVDLVSSQVTRRAYLRSRRIGG